MHRSKTGAVREAFILDTARIAATLTTNPNLTITVMAIRLPRQAAAAVAITAAMLAGRLDPNTATRFLAVVWDGVADTGSVKAAAVSAATRFLSRFNGDWNAAYAVAYNAARAAETAMSISS